MAVDERPLWLDIEWFREKDEDDHFYGAWSGGSKAQGGHAIQPGGKTEEQKRRHMSAIDRAKVRERARFLGRKEQDTEVAVVVRDGKQVFSKEGSKTFVPFNDSETALMKDGHLVHNHPSGRPLSDDDVRFAMSADLASITAVGTTAEGRRYMYTLHRPARGWNDGDRRYHGQKAVEDLRQRGIWQPRIDAANAAASDAISRGTPFSVALKPVRTMEERANVEHANAVWRYVAAEKGWTYERATW